MDNASHRMLALLSGYWHSQGLFVMAELGLADRLASGPQHSDALADATGCDRAALFRFLRAMASAGVLQELDGGRFASTPLSDTLRSDRVGSLHPLARLGGHPLHWQAWGGLLQSVRSGRTAFDAVHGRTFFDALAADADLSQIFNQVMDRSVDLEAAIANVLDVGACTTIVDVGGGRGSLARRLAAAHPDASVMLFDVPHVIAAVPDEPAIELRAGDCLAAVPAGADAYVLKFVLHDWDDARAVRLLENCRDAMHAHSRLFVIEVIVPADAAPSMAKTHDINMMVLTGGRERRLDEYRALFSSAGLDLTGVVPAGHDVSIISGRAIPR